MPKVEAELSKTFAFAVFFVDACKSQELCVVDLNRHLIGILTHFRGETLAVFAQKLY